MMLSKSMKENVNPKPTRRKPSRERRRNRRELERRLSRSSAPVLSLPQEQASSASSALKSNWQGQFGGRHHQNEPVEASIQPAPAQTPFLPDPQPLQVEYRLAQVHTLQTTQVLSQWNSQGELSQYLLTTGQQYRSWHFSSGQCALQLQEVEHTVEQRLTDSAGTQSM